MKDTLPHFTLRITRYLHEKLAYIAEYEGRSKNKEVEQLIRKRIIDFETKNGEID